MMKKINQTLKYIIMIVVVVLLRLVPHPANVEPIMCTTMPFAKKGGWLAGMLFPLLVMLGYDFATGTLGVWSYWTIGTYSLIGLIAGLFFKNRKSNMLNYITFAIIATIIYDGITGIGMGVFLFGQSFMISLIGQIPFTINHLVGNIILSGILSPFLYQYILNNKQFEIIFIYNRFKHNHNKYLNNN